MRTDPARSTPRRSIAGLAHLLENDRQGFRKLVQNDDDEQGRNLPGYYHTVTLGPDESAKRSRLTNSRRRLSTTTPVKPCPFRSQTHYVTRNSVCPTKSRSGMERSALTSSMNSSMS